MEQEQPTSKFKNAPEVDIVSSEEYFDPKRFPDFRYSFPDQEVLFRRVVAYFYRFLDGLTNNKSYFFTNPYRDAQKPYAELIDFLRSEGLTESAGFLDERHNDAPFFYRFFIRGAYPKGITDGKHIEMTANSCGRDLNTLFSKGVGEFLERYFLTLYHKKKLMYASPKFLAQKNISFIPLEQIDEFSKEQKTAYPKRKWSEESILGWEKVERVATGKKILVPAQLVYWNYELADEVGEPFLREPNTNGAGGMFSKEEAVLSGLYELIQRDSFLIYWLDTLSPPQIDPKSVPNVTFQNIISDSDRYGFKIYCLNTTLDTNIPSFIVVIIDSSGQGPYFTCGGGASLDPVESLLSALQEAWSVYISQRDRPLFELPQDFTPFRSHIDREERMYIAANPAYAKNYEFFVSGPVKKLSEYTFLQTPGFSSPKEELDFAVRQVEALGPGYEIYAHLVSNPLLKKLGYHVAKVVVPEIMSLYLHEPNAPLAKKRLKSVSAKLGFFSGNKFNSWPHPFP